MRGRYGARGDEEEEEEDEEDIEKREQEEHARRSGHSIEGILTDRCEWILQTLYALISTDFRKNCGRIVNDLELLERCAFNKLEIN